METTMSFVNIGVGIGVFVAILWGRYSLVSKSNAHRNREPRAQKIVHQPWDPDKTGGRGNR